MNIPENTDTAIGTYVVTPHHQLGVIVLCDNRMAKVRIDDGTYENFSFEKLTEVGQARVEALRAQQQALGITPVLFGQGEYMVRRAEGREKDRPRMFTVGSAQGGSVMCEEHLILFLQGCTVTRWEGSTDLLIGTWKRKEERS